MKKEKDDNILENKMGDLIICDCNVSELIRNNNKKHEKELVYVKTQRNNAEKAKQFYKNAFELTFITSFMIIVFSLLLLLLLQIGKSDSSLENCISNGNTESRCLKSEGVY